MATGLKPFIGDGWTYVAGRNTLSFPTTTFNKQQPGRDLPIAEIRKFGKTLKFVCDPAHSGQWDKKAAIKKFVLMKQ